MALATCESCKHRHYCGSQDIEACRRGEAVLTWEPWTNADVDAMAARVDTLEAAYLRTRISQLRRIADACKSLFSRAIETSERRAPEFPPAERIIAINARIRRFRAACLAEIERLRGEG